MAESSHARKPDDVGAIQRASTTSSVAATSDSSCLDVSGESCLRNPLREIRTVGSVREEISRWCHGGPKRARSWKRRTQPRKTYSLSGLLYSEERRFINRHHVLSAHYVTQNSTALSVTDLLCDRAPFSWQLSRQFQNPAASRQFSSTN